MHVTVYNNNPASSQAVLNDPTEPNPGCYIIIINSAAILILIKSLDAEAARFIIYKHFHCYIKCNAQLRREQAQAID